MKTQNSVSVKTNKVLGIYTVLVASLSVGYILTTYIQHFTL
ncbi:MAG: hypothetical protein ABNH00_09060 [Dokdonia sp.]|jgi:hypothetical protein